VIKQAPDVICGTSLPAGNSLASRGSPLKRNANSGAVAGFGFLFVGFRAWHSALSVLRSARGWNVLFALIRDTPQNKREAEASRF